MKNKGSTLPGGLTWNCDGQYLANICDGGPDISTYTVSGSTAVNTGVIRPMVISLSLCYQ